MPNIKSAKKRVKIIEKKTLRNSMIKSGYKSAVKKFELALEAGKFRITVTATYFSGETAIDTRIQNLVINVGIPDGGIPTRSNSIPLIVGISCGCIVLVGTFVGSLYIIKKKKKLK